MTNVLELSRNFCYNNNREVKARMSRRTREAMASELKLPQHYVELDEQEMTYVDGGAGFPTLLISAPLNFLLCLNPAVGIGFGGVVGLAKWGFKTLAKNATKALVRTIFNLAATGIGFLYSGWGAAISNACNDATIFMVVNVFFGSFGGLGSIIGLAVDAVDGRIDGWIRW